MLANIEYSTSNGTSEGNHIIMPNVEIEFDDNELLDAIFISIVGGTMLKIPKDKITYHDYDDTMDVYSCQNGDWYLIEYPDYM